MNRLESIIQKITKECVGMSIWTTSEGEMRIHLVVISQVKNSLKITRTTSHNDFNEVFEQIPVRSPLIVSIDGYGIIHKSVNQEDYNEGISKVLPNAKLSDLYIQKTDQSEVKKVIFSVARKDKINEIFTLLNNAGFYPYNIILGPFSILNLLPLISQEEEINIPEYKFSIKNRTIISFKRADRINTSQTIAFGDEEILSDYLVAVSNCLGFFSPGISITNNITALETQRKEYLSKKIIHAAGLVILLFIFTMLIVNFSMYTKYRSENQILEQTIRTGKRLMQETDSLKEILKSKKELAEAGSDKSTKFYAYYSDQLASIIPSQITLDRICIYPIEKSSKNRNMPVFKKGTILISGKFVVPGYLEKMIRRASSFNWVKDVKILSYKDMGSDPASFELEINTK